MTCTIPEERLKRLIEFHGHSCPGLAIGVRASEYALATTSQDAEEHAPDLIAVVETDMCGVDAIQFLTGCTFGKGNLIHRDHGKMAFSFYDRNTGEGVRLLLSPEVRDDMDGEMGPLMKKAGEGTATESEQSRLAELRNTLQDRFMTMPLKELFITKPAPTPAPRPARILASLACDDCGEKTMESRTRRFAGRTLCIPCFERVEQKV